MKQLILFSKKSNEAEEKTIFGKTGKSSTFEHDR